MLYRCLYTLCAPLISYDCSPVDLTITVLSLAKRKITWWSASTVVAPHPYPLNSRNSEDESELNERETFAFSEVNMVSGSDSILLCLMNLSYSFTLIFWARTDNGKKNNSMN